jgi:hypothetical protein
MSSFFCVHCQSNAPFGHKCALALEKELIATRERAQQLYICVRTMVDARVERNQKGRTEKYLRLKEAGWTMAFNLCGVNPSEGDPREAIRDSDPPR